MTPEAVTAQLRAWADEWAHPTPSHFLDIDACWHEAMRVSEARHGHKPQS
jgi:hypothetical protein